MKKVQIDISRGTTPFDGLNAVFSCGLFASHVTVGDIIETMFPGLDVEIKGTYVSCWIGEHKWMEFDWDLWKMPYREVMKEWEL